MQTATPDTDVVLDLDFEPVIACEGGAHPTGSIGHIIEEPGAFMVVSPCIGPKVIQCAGRVQYMRAFSNFLFCSVCDRMHPIEEYRFVPVTGDGQID